MNEADEVPPSGDRKVPRFLWMTYILLLIGGIWAFCTFWNGSHGWLDRGFWKPLQQAANTTFEEGNKSCSGSLCSQNGEEVCR